MTNKPIQHLSLFSGLGGAEASLDACGVPHVTIARSEIQKKPDLIYQEIWGDSSRNLGDISTIDWEAEKIDRCDLITGGFPCQPFSKLGFQKGVKDPRFIIPFNGLLKAIETTQPKYILLENVVLPFPVLAFVIKKVMNKGYVGGYRTMCPYHDLGYVQTRKRVYLYFSRLDVPRWEISDPPMGTYDRQTITLDPSADTSKLGGNCYKIGDKRAKNILDMNNQKIACVTARGHDAHCSYMTWVKTEDGHRGYTPKELFNIFAWEQEPKIEFSRSSGVSRSSFYHAIGNSWHVGHAKFMLQSCPLLG